MYIKTVLFSSSFSDEGISYLVPDFLEEKIFVGKIVLVPYWKKEKEAIVIEILEKSDYDESKIKNIISVNENNVFLFEYQIKLINFLSKKYFTLIHHCLNLFFPKNLKEKIKKNKIFSNGDNLLQNLSINPITSKEKKTKGEKYQKCNIGTLSPKQQDTYQKIINSKNKNILLHWITWSWKTEIYMKIIEKNLQKNKQTLLLVPEIILNSQIFERIKKVFKEKVILINSTVSEANKTKLWLDIYNEKSKIVVWTRSALFYPYKNLWTIIVDEEHDNSYFSDKNPRYSAISVALEIWKLLDIKIILASGTPSINDMYRAVKWKFELISLMEKFINKK